MAVTVRNILDLDIIQQRTEVIAGLSGIDKAVTYVTIQEAPDFYEWVSGGEFVLTTWYAFSQQPDLQGEAFRRLAQKIAAIGIKVGRFIEEVPQEIIDIANEYGIPVFAVSRETKFREIIQAISAELNNEQTNLLMEVDKYYQELVKVALAGGDESAMLQGIGKRGKFACFFVTPDIELLATYFPANYNRVATDSKLQSIRQALLSQDNFLSFQKIGDLNIFPCIARQLLLGYLVIIWEDVLSEKLVLMANQVAVFLTLKLMERLDTEQKMLSSLLDDVLYRHNLSEEQIQERLLLFGLKAKQQFRIIILQAHGIDEQSLLEMRKISYFIKGVLGEALVNAKPDEIVIIVGNQGVDTEKAPYWVKQVKEKIAKVSGFMVGIGPIVEGAGQLEVSYRLAKQTIKAARLIDVAGVVYYREHLARMVLLRGMGSIEYQYLIQQVIDPLKQYDDKYRSDLLRTLQVMIFARDMDEASSTLHIHSNTVRYRLNKVATITGYDFFSPLGRYVLTTAFLLQRAEPDKK